MAKMRIHELAKEIAEKGLSDSKTISADIIKILQSQGHEVSNAMNSITEEMTEAVRRHYSSKNKTAAPAPAEAPAPTHESAAKQPVASKNEASAQRNERKLYNRNGMEINYTVRGDGRLIDLANGKELPFKMGNDGRIRKLDGTLLGHKPDAAQGQQNNDQRRNSAAQQARPNRERPVSQVFDGRSERDKRVAATATNQNRNSKNGLSEALGDKIKSFESQLDPNAQPYVQKPKAPKVEPELPVMPKDETVSTPAMVQPAQPTAAVAEQQPVETVETATEASVAPKVIVRENVYEKMAAKAEQKKAQEAARREQKPQGDRPQGERRPFGDRPQGERRPYGDRPQGERRPFGDRPQGERRPYGDRPQGDRPQGERRPFGDRPQGERRPYGDRPQGERRPFGDRPQGERRPFGDRPQGERPAFNRDGARPGMGGGRGPQMGVGFGNKDKDEDNQRRSFARKPERPSGGSVKAEFANELGKGQRAESLKDRRKDKNDRRDRDFDDDGLKAGKNGKKDPNRKGAFQKPVAKPVEVVEDDIKTIEVGEIITIKELADKMKQQAATIIKKLFLSGKMVNLNSEITFEEAEEIALEYEIICEHEKKVNVVEELLKETEEAEELLQKRPPVVCVMGHVDHGKTSLLDAIRKTNVTSREAGGITQHIGAYMVEIDGRKITFLDTPGHEAFTSMRMRGAKSTDIAILVVAADDGVMPQTIEAINHAKAAGVSIIVAVNKIDKPGANIDRVKQELTEHELVAEDWGGDTVLVPVSAKTGEGIENLLEMVLLTADVLELKANPDRLARGIVIESKLDKGRGPVATVLIQKGTLNVGDNVAIGSAHGKVRAMIDDLGRKVKTATPSTPVEILGLDGVPQAGEVMMAVTDEKEAKKIAEAYISQSKEQLIAESKKNMSLDSLFSQIQAGDVKELNLIIKADVMGSVEAVKQSLVKLSNDEVVVRVIHGGVGNINESDVNLAAASGAIIIGFNVKPDNTAKDIADHEKIDIRLYRVIYDAINDIESAMKGMLKPIYREKVTGHAEIRQLFKASGVGIIAGSFVLDGKIERGSSARIFREGKQIWEGSLASLKRFKDDVKEVAAGYECGLVFDKFSDFAELDTAEFYIMEEVPRT